MTSNVNGDLDGTGVYGLDDEPHNAICPGCNGTGEAYMGRLASRPGPCRECLGSGEVTVDE